MKKHFLLISIALTAASITSCANNSGSGPFSMFAAKVVAGNENYVTVSDPVGMPGKNLEMATSHCATFGKSATYQSKGGDSFECSGTTFCTTYQCVSR